MIAREYDKRIEARVLRTLSRMNLQSCCDLMVAATPDGKVYLNGIIQSEANRQMIEQIVRDVPGVTEVFFNFGPDSTHEIPALRR